MVGIDRLDGGTGDDELYGGGGDDTGPKVEDTADRAQAGKSRMAQLQARRRRGK